MRGAEMSTNADTTLFRKFTPEQCGGFERRARTKAVEVEEVKKAKIAELTEEVRLLEDKIQKQKKESQGRLKIGAITFTEKQMEALLNIFNGADMTSTKVKALRDAARKFPPLPSETERLDLAAMSTPTAEVGDDCQWCSLLA